MTWTEIPDIELFSDGGAEPNPGKGGFGVILSYKGKGKNSAKVMSSPPTTAWN